MGLAVPCPHCQAVLKVPTDKIAAAVGKRAKCSQCGERFTIPAEAVPPPTAAEPVYVPEVEPTAPLAALPTEDNPFSFDAGGDAVVVPRNPTAPRRKAARPAPPPRARKPAARPRSPLPLILAGVAGLFLLGCAFFAVALYVILSDTPATPTDPSPAPAAPADPAAPLPTEPAAHDAPEGNPPEVTPPAPAAGFTELPTPRAEGRKVLTPAYLKLTLDVPFDAVRAAVPLPSTTATLTVLWRSNPGFQGLGVQESVDVYAAKGGRTSRVEFPADGLPPGPRRFAVNAAGTLAAVEAPAGRLTLIDLTAGKLTLAGGEPFPDVPEPKPLLTIDFVDLFHAAAFDELGRGQVWDARSGESRKPAKPFAPRDAIGPALSNVAGGRAISYAGADALSLNASPAGAGLTLVVSQPLNAAACDPGRGASVVSQGVGGQWVAAAFPTPAGGAKLLVQNLGNVQVGPIALPPAVCPIDGLTFLNANKYLAAFTAGRTRATLIDGEARVPFAVATAAGPVRIYGEPQGGLLWWLFADPDNPDKTLARSAVFGLGGSYYSVSHEARKAGKPVALVLTADGVER